jgi:hypothetical protein
MVSAVLLLALALATLPVIEQGAQRSGADRSRSVAANLAKSDQDRMRLLPLGKLVNLRAVQTKIVDGTSYNVQSRADLTRDGSGLVACSSTDSSRSEYFKIQTTVTWPKMQNIAPVVMESIVSPGIAGLDPTKGTLTVKILNEAGIGVQGINVAAAGLGDTTDQGGCAVFGQLTQGAVTANFSAGGYVDQNGNGTGTVSGTVVGGATSSLSANYDKAASIAVTIRDTLAAGNLAVWPVIEVKNAARIRQTPATLGAAATNWNATGLYPFSGGYLVYAGNCDGNNPATYDAAFYSTNTESQAKPAPGGAAAATVRLRQVALTIKKTGNGTVNWTVRPDSTKAAMVNTDKCGVDVTPKTGTAAGAVPAASGTATYATAFNLPWGQYIVCADNNLTGTSAKHTDFTLNVTPNTAAANPQPTGGSVVAGEQRVTVTLPAAPALAGRC